MSKKIGFFFLLFIFILSSTGQVLARVNYDKFYVQGAVYYASGEYEKAIPLLKEAINSNPFNERAWFFLGYCYNVSGQINNAIESYKQAIRINPDLIEAYSCLANAHIEIGRHEDAIDFLKQVIRLKPNDHEAYHNLGITYASLSLFTDAIGAYKQAIRINPGLIDAYIRLGIAYTYLGYLKAAKEAYKEAERINPIKKNEQLTAEAWKVEKMSTSREGKKKNRYLHPLHVKSGQRDVSFLKDHIHEFLMKWKSAWQNSSGQEGDIRTYISSYSDDFLSKGLNKDGWRYDKESKNRKKAWIVVELKDIKIIEQKKENIVEACFFQDYRSSNYSEKSIKMLKLKKEKAGWKIVSEKSY